MREYEILQLDSLDGKTIQFNFQDRADVGKVQNAMIGGGSYKIKYWGAENGLPQYREKVLMDNNIVGEMIETKAGFVVGNGIKPYSVEIDDKGQRNMIPEDIPSEIQDFMDEFQFVEAMMQGARDDMMHANAVMEFQQNIGGRVIGCKGHRIKHFRLSAKNTRGDIPAALYHPDWTNLDKENQYIKPKPIRMYEKGVRGNFVLIIKQGLFDDGYYSHPAYWGGKEWIELSNTIPKFHKANLENGYLMRYHIKIPKDYFLDKEKLEKATDDAAITDCYNKAKTARQKFIDQVNNFLAGVNNAGRAIFTAYDFDMGLGKEHPGIKIEEIKTDMKDESLLKLFEKSNQANISSQGIHPTLANIETQGKLSSGSEMLNAYNFYLSVKASAPRRRLYRWWDVILKINKWDTKYSKLKWGFENIELKTLDDNKSGKEEVIKE